MISFSIAVGELAAWVYRSGDLSYETSHYGRNRAAEGRQIHQWLQKRRRQEFGEDYQTEISVSGSYQTNTLEIQVRGRIDGLNLSCQRIEEIKSIACDYADRDAAREQVHWAQLYLYAYLWAKQNAYFEKDSCQEMAAEELGLEKKHIQLNLVYVQAEDRQVFQQQKRLNLVELEIFFQQTLERFSAWAEIWAKHEQHKIQSATRLTFPYPQFRAGQRHMSAQIYQAIHHAQPIMIQAATGIGKTLAALFPAVKTIAKGYIKRIIFLSARTTGQQVAQGAIQCLRDQGLEIYDLTISAKSKVCLEPEAGCDPKLCPYAENYFNKLSKAMDYAIQHYHSLQQENIANIAKRFQICPFELSLELANWCDVIICDYNYMYDPSVALRRFFFNYSSKSAVLVDEAHNLVERAREMYSATIEQQDLLTLKGLLKQNYPGVGRQIAQLSRLMSMTTEEPKSQLSLLAAQNEDSSQSLFSDQHCIARAENLSAYLQLPEPLLKAFRALRFKMEMVLNQPGELQQKQHFLELFFTLNHFLNMASLLNESFVVIIYQHRKQSRIQIYCLSPAMQIEKINADLHSVCYFSATLSPHDYYADILLAQSLPVVNIASPFPAQHQLTLLAVHIPTTYQQRENSLAKIQVLVREACLIKKGNYLLFFPSYWYLEQFIQDFNCQDLHLLVQQRNMSATEKEGFLAQLAAHQGDRESVLAVAVMGAGFSEGIDLHGQRLIGCFVVGVGLAQINFQQDLIKAYYQQHKQAGFAYAYQFPGITKVLQSAGRVIRSSEDKGFVLLIDSRYAGKEYQSRLPAWWQLRRISNNQQALDEIRRFWQIN